MSDEVLDAMIRGLPPEKLVSLKSRIDTIFELPIEADFEVVDKHDPRKVEVVLELAAFLSSCEDKASLTVTKEAIQFKFDSDDSRDYFLKTFLDLMREVRRMDGLLPYPEA